MNVGLACPFCGEREIETHRTAHFARGYLLMVSVGRRELVGCCRCVAAKLRLEALKSLLFGWFSPKAFGYTVIWVPYNLVRSFFVRPDPAKAIAFLQQVGALPPSVQSAPPAAAAAVSRPAPTAAPNLKPQAAPASPAAIASPPKPRPSPQATPGAPNPAASGAKGSMRAALQRRDRRQGD